MVAAGEAFSENALALAAYLVLVLGPGLLVTSRCGPKDVSPLERALLAWGVGVAVTVALVFFGGFVHPHAGGVVALPLAVAGFVVSFRRVDARAAGERLRADAPFLLLLPLLAVGVAPWIDVGFETPDGYALTGYYDHLLHTATLFEWDRGIPPQQMPHLAGEPWWPYHNGTDALAWLPFHYLGVSPFAAHDVALRGLSLVLAALGVGVVVRRVSGSAWTGAVFTAFFVVPLGSQHDVLLNLSQNSPSSVALSCLPALLLALAHHHVAPSRSLAAAVGLAAAALFLTKANFFLLVAPGLGLAGLLLMRAGRTADAAIAAGAGAVVIVPTSLYLGQIDVVRGPTLGYGQFGEWAAGRADLLSHWAAGAPDGLRAPLAAALWIVHAGGAAWALALLGLVVAVRRSDRLVPWQGVVAGAVGGLVFLVLFVVDENARQLTAWNIAFPLLFPVRLAVWTGAGVGLAALFARLPERVRRPGPWVLFLTAGALLAPALGRPPVQDGTLLPHPWLDAARYLRDETAPEAVVLTYANVWGATFTSGIAGRRVVVERPVLMFATFASTADRLADLEIVFRSDDPSVVHALLSERGVTHLIVRDARRLRLPEPTGLTEVFRSGDVAVLRVDRVSLPPPDPDRLARLRAGVTARMRAILRVYTGEDESAVATEFGVEPGVVHRWADPVGKGRPLADDLIFAPPPDQPESP